MIDDVKTFRASFLKEFANGTLLTQCSYIIM